MTQVMLVTLGLAIVGQVVYQIGQRAVPANASLFVVLALAYCGAGLLCVALAWWFGAFNSTANLRAAAGWPTWVITLAIVAIEIGYLTAYRAGWTIGTAFATASTVTVFALAVVGWISLGNALSPRQISGLVCSCAGVWLLVDRA
jgi:drug/metabolite transporter (DMT)-like permease